ncbi:MAG TPA: MBL fold metallo-hydrolase [Nocardioides sp.]|nr:MBL fold metallo-hydrolase [Nocardioides sp.]
MSAERVTKFGHSCVRIESGAARIVIDPGMFTDVGAVDGATAILITHEHPDHWTAEHLLASDAPVITIQAVADKIRAESPEAYERVQVIAPGETVDVGLPVTAVGELHAVIHPEFPRFHNSGFLLHGAKSYFHPGDALTGPDVPVDVLFAPVSAPWARSSELIDFMRSVKAPQNLAIHDRIYSDVGAMIFDGHTNTFLPKEGLAYVRLKDGEDL